MQTAAQQEVSSSSRDHALGAGSALEGRSSGHRLVKWASAQFPIEPLEQFVVRDGRGNAVERWTASEVSRGKDATRITFSVQGYRSAGAL